MVVNESSSSFSAGLQLSLCLYICLMYFLVIHASHCIVVAGPMIFSRIVGLTRSSALERCWAELIWRNECGGFVLCFVTFNVELKIMVVFLA